MRTTAMFVFTSLLISTTAAHGDHDEEAEESAMRALASTLSPFASLLIFCLVMSISTFILGSLPLFVKLSHIQMILLQSTAAGLLLGAGITIVLPEGVSNLYAAHQQAPPHGHHHAAKDFDPEHILGLSVLTGFLLMYFVDRIFSSQHRHFESPPSSSSTTHHDHPHNRPHSAYAGTTTATAAAAAADRRTRLRSESHLRSDQSDLTVSANSQRPPHSRTHSTPLRIGGFRLLLRLPRIFSSSSSGGAGNKEDDSDSFAGFSRASITSLLGLCIHALADGVAMGATSLSPSASSSSSSVAGTTTAGAATPSTVLGAVLRRLVAAGAGAGAEGHPHTDSDDPDAASSLRLIVFLAIMLHKAPAALGLSTLLLSQGGGSRLAILRAIALFSLSTPLGALATYALGYWILQSGNLAFAASSSAAAAGGGGGQTVGGGGGGLSSKHIGMALTFSAGTFLYVAMHALGELMGGSSHHMPESDGRHAHGHHHRHHHEHDHIYEIGEDEEEEESGAFRDEGAAANGGRRRGKREDEDGAHEPLLDDDAAAGDESSTRTTAAAAAVGGSRTPGAGSGGGGSGGGPPRDGAASSSGSVRSTGAGSTSSEIKHAAQSSQPLRSQSTAAAAGRSRRRHGEEEEEGYGGAGPPDDDDDDDGTGPALRYERRRRGQASATSSVLSLEVAKTALLLVGAGIPRFLQTLTGGHGH
ncbi:hypothetical protein V8E36_004789 [Tilletia maclaganii]